MFLLCFIVLASIFLLFFSFLVIQPTAVWLRFIGMHNVKKHGFWKLLKSYLFLLINSSFCVFHAAVV